MENIFASKINVSAENFSESPKLKRKKLHQRSLLSSAHTRIPSYYERDQNSRPNTSLPGSVTKKNDSKKGFRFQNKTSSQIFTVVHPSVKFLESEDFKDDPVKKKYEELNNFVKNIELKKRKSMTSISSNFFLSRSKSIKNGKSYSFPFGKIISNKIVKLHDDFEGLGLKETDHQKIQMKLILENSFRKFNKAFAFAKEIVETFTSKRKNSDNIGNLDTKEIIAKVGQFDSECSMAITFFMGKYLISMNLLDKALKLLKYSKRQGKSLKIHGIMCKIYKNLGECSSKIGQFSLSKHYYTKLLNYAWLSNNKEKEIFAYEKLGLQMYYLGEAKKAEFFHSKSMSAFIEPEESMTKSLFMSNFEIQQKYNRTKKRKYLRNSMDNGIFQLENDGLYEVSSSDASFEYPIPKGSNGETNSIPQVHMNKILKNLKSETLKKNANKNIRYQENLQLEEAQVLKKAKLLCKPFKASDYAKKSKIKERVFISHLSSNRSKVSTRPLESDKFLRSLGIKNEISKNKEKMMANLKIKQRKILNELSIEFEFAFRKISSVNFLKI